MVGVVDELADGKPVDDDETHVPSITTGFLPTTIVVVFDEPVHTTICLSSTIKCQQKRTEYKITIRLKIYR